jgi:ATP-dependent 26S proteasome regulatory subunit
VNTREEIGLLIKSRYPLLFLETADEDYSIAQLKELADEQNLEYFQWSLTGGLVRGENENAYYQSGAPGIALKTILDLLFKPQPWAAALYVMKDITAHLNDPINLRLCKDILKQVKNRRDTLIFLNHSYNLPKDLESAAVHIACGYPEDNEIRLLIVDSVAELTRWHDQLTVKLNNLEIEQLVKAFKGLTLQQIKNALHQAALDNNRLCIDDLVSIEKYKRRIYDQEGLLEFYPLEVKEEIGGFHNLKKWLAERKESFSLAGKQELPPPKGVLLMGVQGCGKSLAAKIISQKLSLPLYRLDLGKLYGSYIGQTEENLRKALKTISRLSPLCLWIDEIEKGLSVSDSKSDGGVSKRVLATFLIWMQERKESCFIAATANDVLALPPELLRKGRFDEIFFVDLPDRVTRADLFRIHLGKRGLSAGEDSLLALADASAGFSGAEIEQVIISALYSAKTAQQKIGPTHLMEQIRSTRPLSVLRSEEIEALRHWARDRTIPV